MDTSRANKSHNFSDMGPAKSMGLAPPRRPRVADAADTAAVGPESKPVPEAAAAAVAEAEAGDEAYVVPFTVTANYGLTYCK